MYLENKFDNYYMTGYQRHWFPLLDIIRNLLAKSNIDLCKVNTDGRINSAQDEEIILKTIYAQRVANPYIEDTCDIILPKNREWYDIVVVDKTNIYPPAFINIKTSKMEAADNLNCKLGIYYTVTGYECPCNNSLPWKKYFKMLGENLDFNAVTDYFFLIVNKQNTSDIILTSLRSIETLTPNGNNLPFQCCWKYNRDLRCIENKKEELAYILNVFEKSLKLESKKYSNYIEHIQPQLLEFERQRRLFS